MSSDAELDVYNDPLRGKKTGETRFLKNAPVKFLSHLHQNLRMFCDKFLKQHNIFFLILNFIARKITKNKGKNNLLLDPIEQNA